MIRHASIRAARRRDVVRVCMVNAFSRVWISQEKNIARCQLKRGKLSFPFPRLRLRIWSRETGSAVPSHASLLISTLKLNLVRTHGILPDFNDAAHIYHIQYTESFNEWEGGGSLPGMTFYNYVYMLYRPYQSVRTPLTEPSSRQYSPISAYNKI